MKITKAHFAYFRKRCLYWIDKLNLNDYEWYIAAGGANEGAVASFRHLHANKVVRIHLAKSWGDPVSEEALDDTAFHEVFEAYLCRLSNIAEARDGETEVETERHAIVHRVWNLLKGSGI